MRWRLFTSGPVCLKKRKFCDKIIYNGAYNLQQWTNFSNENEKHSLFCSVHLAFSWYDEYFFVVSSARTSLTTRRSSVQCVLFWGCATTIQATNFHLLSILLCLLALLYPVHFISVTFYLKIYDCFFYVFLIFFRILLLSLLHGEPASSDRVRDSGLFHGYMQLHDKWITGQLINFSGSIFFLFFC